MTLDKFKNIHRDKDIYVLGSGKSVDFIDNNFFDGKIVIGINQVYRKISCQYLVRKEPEIVKEVLSDPKTINSIIFMPGDQKTHVLKKISDESINRIIFFNNDENIFIVDKLPSDDKLIVSYSTITTGIHLAAYMGARNIILVGHDCGTLNGEPNFSGYHTDATYKIAHKNGKEQYKKWIHKIEAGTVTLKKLLKEKYGCNTYSLNPFINFGLEGNEYISVVGGNCNRVNLKKIKGKPKGKPKQKRK